MDSYEYAVGQRVASITKGPWAVNAVGTVISVSGSGTKRVFYGVKWDDGQFAGEAWEKRRTVHHWLEVNSSVSMARRESCSGPYLRYVQLLLNLLCGFPHACLTEIRNSRKSWKNMSFQLALRKK